MKHRYFSALALPFVFFALSGGCNGGVKHPTPGEPNDEETCANRPSGEMNCLACASLPGCAWCGSPAPSKSQCQPGVSAEMPATCLGEWAQSTEDCEGPPPELREDM
ncbi:MAG: hypothetical protein B6A08_14390 [Sorangiineae bacterium NIC37A_2]|nr:MAG: hypothetical protein B6A08_14390 [Sorangiineae bacterium NIC37A_2]